MERLVRHKKTKETCVFLGFDEELKEGHQSPSAVLYIDLGKSTRGGKLLHVDVDEFEKEYEFVK